MEVVTAPSHTAGAVRASPRAAGLRLREGSIIAAFIAPALLVYGIFVLYPIVQSVAYSFYQWSGIAPGSTFVGLGNYQQVLQTPVFWKALGNNLILVIASIVTQLPAALAIALLLSTKLRGMRLFRTIYLFPLLMSTVAIALLWTFIYNPNLGLLNALLQGLNLRGWQRGWLGDEATALWAVIGVISWHYVPFYMVLFLAGLTNIPHELYEAARLDGAGNWGVFQHVTLPLMRGVIRTAAILSLIGSLKYFDLIWVMTGGGPNNATELMATYMYKQAFEQYRMGYASSVAVVLFVIAFVISSAVLIIDQRRSER
ncbi:MAG: sugar ABC transporter permease [Chloroflexota bacterium]|nr:sugar ABC transporter permease [Chloroflexota bacterium]